VQHGHPSAPAIGVADLAAASDVYVVDVREVHEFQAGHLPGAVSIPMSVLPVRVQELPRDRTVHVVCQSGARSAQVVQWLIPQGYDALNVAGGTAAWILAGHPVE
jgi:rhodanese-related sulfurtransferase